MAVFRQYDPYHRSDRSAQDRRRHREKVEKAIKENLGDIVAEEAIISSDGKKKVKIPIKGIKEYRFVYGSNARGTATGTGKEKRGDKFAQNTGKKGKQGAGDSPGEEIYETEVTIDELIDYLFEDLELPFNERKKFREVLSERMAKRKGYSQHGLRHRLDKKKSLIQKIKRKQGTLRAAQDFNGNPNTPQKVCSTGNDEAAAKPRDDQEEEERFPFHEQDLRYKRVVETIKKHSNAVCFCIMDTSGSMDKTKKYLARTFYFLLYRFLQTKYRHVEIVFIAHHTEAKEVDENTFFHKGESGGTFISSGYLKALEVIEERFDPSMWNVYIFHCSDGDNWDSDNEKAVRAAEKMAGISNLFGYGEIKPDSPYRSWESSMIQVFKQIKAENFHTLTIRDKSDIWPVFKKFLSKEKAEEVA